MGITLVIHYYTLTTLEAKKNGKVITRLTNGLGAFSWHREKRGRGRFTKGRAGRGVEKHFCKRALCRLDLITQSFT